MTGIGIYKVVISTLIALIEIIFAAVLARENLDKSGKITMFVVGITYMLALVGMWI